MKVEAMLIPVPPRFLLPLNHEFVDVHVGLMSKPFQNFEFSLSFGISPDLQALCTLYHVFCQTNLDAVLNDVAAKAPAVELSLHKELFSYLLLQYLDPSLSHS